MITDETLARAKRTSDRCFKLTIDFCPALGEWSAYGEDSDESPFEFFEGYPTLDGVLGALESRLDAPGSDRKPPPLTGYGIAFPQGCIQ